MNAQAKYFQVRAAIDTINGSLDSLREVASEDGERGEDAEQCLDVISEQVNHIEGEALGLNEWLKWLEADMEPERK